MTSLNCSIQFRPKEEKGPEEKGSVPFSSGKRVLTPFPVLVVLLIAGFSSLTYAVPTIEDIETDIREFQRFFSQRFPGISLESYNDGVNALPQYANRLVNWELLMEFPPYETEMDLARNEWGESFANGGSFDSCFIDKPPANRYPVFRDGRVRTIVGDINDCLQTNGEAPLDTQTGKIARLVAAYKERWNGEPIEIDLSSVGMRAMYEKGRQYYWAKRGQLNFSCANCHVHNAGNQIRGDVLSAGLGHTTGFPVYRTKWAQSDQPWGTVHRRYAGCNKQVRATPLKPQSAEYIALEVYETVMNTGIPLKVPSQRQ